MSELREVAEQQQTQEVQPVWKYKVIAIACIILALYVAYCCVFQKFMLLPFMNQVMKAGLGFINKMILFFSRMIGRIFSWF